MKLFKNKKEINELLNNNPVGEYIILLNEGYSVPDVAKKFNITRQNVHLKLISFYKKLEVVEPELIKLSEEFDTYLNLNKIVPKFLVGIVFRYMLYKNKRTRNGVLLKGVLVDEKIKFGVIWEDKTTKTKPLAMTGDTYKLLKNNTPLSIKEFATLVSLNEAKLQLYFKELLKGRVYVFKDKICSVRYNSFIYAVSVYCQTYYEGKLYDLYDELYDDLKVHLKIEKLDKDTFYKKLLVHPNFKKDTFCYMEDGSNEFLKYAKKHDIKYVLKSKESNLANQRKKKKNYSGEWK